MLITKEVEGVPIYVCQTPPLTYKEDWGDELCEEIATSLQQLFSTPPLLRGIWKPDLDLVARTGADHHHPEKGDLIYVAKSISYVFDLAKTAILIFDPSSLEELKEDPIAEWNELEFNRYEFLVHPNDALKGIIDLRSTRETYNLLRSRNQEVINEIMQDRHRQNI